MNSRTCFSFPKPALQTHLANVDGPHEAILKEGQVSGCTSGQDEGADKNDSDFLCFIFIYDRELRIRFLSIFPAYK